MEAVRQNPVVEQLRERIRKLEAAPRRYLSSLRTGLPPFDALFPGGGLPLGSAVELWGEAASGRLHLALRVVAAAHREGRLAAYVDGPGELYPPAVLADAVDLRKLLIVQPPPETGGPGRLVWSTLQLLRSGAFAAVVLDLTHTGQRLSFTQGQKLREAAIRSGTLLLLLTPAESPAQGMLRLRTRATARGGSVEGELEIEVAHGRNTGRRVHLGRMGSAPVRG